MKNVVVINDEAHHCYREKVGDSEEDKLTGEDQPGGQGEQRGGAALDFRHRGAEAQGRRARCLRSLGHAVLPARLGLRGGHAVPLGGQRFLADGCDRVRHRQAAARAGRATTRSTPTCRSSATSGSTSARQMPKKGAAKSGELDPLASADRAANGALRPLQPLRGRRTTSGSAPASACRRCSSWCATTPPPRSWSMNGSPAGEREDVERRTSAPSITAIWSCSATTTSTAIRCRG